MSYQLRDRPRSLWSLCGSVVEHWSVESKGPRFHSSRGLRIFSLSHARDKTKKGSLCCNNSCWAYDNINWCLTRFSSTQWTINSSCTRKEVLFQWPWLLSIPLPGNASCSSTLFLSIVMQFSDGILKVSNIKFNIIFTLLVLWKLELVWGSNMILLFTYLSWFICTKIKINNIWFKWCNDYITKSYQSQPVTHIQL